jgi:seryl-tRNA synthetase
MISIQHLAANPHIYQEELLKRGKSPDLALELAKLYEEYKTVLQKTEKMRAEKNDFNKKAVKLDGEAKQVAILEMKKLAENLKKTEEDLKMLKEKLDEMILKIPNLSSPQTPKGKDDTDNPVIKHFGQKKEFQFKPKPYYELDVYQKYVSQKDGVKAMGSRGYYMTGKMANFQRVLFNYALDIVLKEGFELFYVPLMLNDKVLTGTGHLPDFDGQQYEVNINENTSYYLVGSSEPSIMGYYMNKNLGRLEKPILNTCQSSCFRKEAGSYGKDQQGILRVHQFEKLEMVAIAKKDEALALFEKFQEIVEKIYSGLEICYQAVEVCSGDMPSKHYRQIDYEAWFPGENKFREICSNGNASDFQNRGLNIFYIDENGQKQTPWGLNCTAITFRTGLAILEQNQTADGKVKLPNVLVDSFGSQWLE